MLEDKKQNSYTKEFKVFIVNERVKNGKTISEIAEEQNIPFYTVKSWMKIYNKSGFDGLCISKKGTKFITYDGVFKMQMVELLLYEKISSYEISKIYGISSGNVRQWKKIFLEKGAEGFNGEKRGRKALEVKKKASNKDIDNSEIKKLEDEIKYLKMENAYLKKLNALVQKKEKSQRKTK